MITFSAKLEEIENEVAASAAQHLLGPFVLSELRFKLIGVHLNCPKTRRHGPRFCSLLADTTRTSEPKGVELNTSTAGSSNVEWVRTEACQMDSSVAGRRL